MAKKDIMLVLLTFFNTLFLVAGISIVYTTLKFDICNESFHLTIKEFLLLYQLIFFSYGVLLLMISIFGFMSMFSEKRYMLDIFGKLLFFLLVLLPVMFCVGVWGKGPKYLRTTMYNAFTSYNTGNCHLDRSINALQNKFSCCGIESPNDWKDIKSYQKRNVSTVLPLSCCSFIYKEHDRIKCVTSYQNGCYLPVFRYICRVLRVFDAIGIGIAICLAFEVICVFEYCSLLKKEQSILETPEALEVTVSNIRSNEATFENVFPSISKVKNENEGTFV